MSIGEILGNQSPSDALLQAGDAQHTGLWHVSLITPHTVMHEVVLEVGVA